MLTNRTQSKVSISGLTYNNLIEDAYNALKDSPEYKDTFSTFTSNEAARMIVELYAYMANQLATRMDMMGNELFVDTASWAGLSRLLKLVGAQVDFASAASTEVEVSTSSTTNPFRLSYGIDATGSQELEFDSATAFKSVNASNSGTTWEFIWREVGDDGEYVYDYTMPFDFAAPSQQYTLHEGITHAQEYTIRTLNPDIITINGSIIKDSVRIYYKKKELAAGTTDAYEIKELKKVDNFFTIEAITANTGIYTIRNTGSGAEICIKAYNSDSGNDNDLGKDLLIMYRTGGGNAGNISIGAISKVQTFNRLGGTDNTIIGKGELTIKNITAGNGGKDQLTTNEIRSTVVNEVRNTKIAITEEDYEYLLPKYDNNIGLLKCYGEKNEEIADLATTYGYYVNPIAVWFIILKKNTLFEESYLSNSMGLTSYINDIMLNILDINPRFDEQYQVNTASINQLYRASELGDHYTESSWQYIFDIDSQGAQVLSEEGANSTITVTNAPYIDSAEEQKRRQNYFNKDVAASMTWEELMSMDVGTADGIYRVTDEDALGGISYRWQRKEFSGDRYDVASAEEDENGTYVKVTESDIEYYVYNPTSASTKYIVSFEASNAGLYVKTGSYYTYIANYYRGLAEYYYIYEPDAETSAWVVDTATSNKIGPYVKRTDLSSNIYYEFEGLVTKYAVASATQDEEGAYIIEDGHYVYDPTSISTKYIVTFEESTSGDYLSVKSNNLVYFLFDTAERYAVTFREKTSGETGKYRKVLENYEDLWERVNFDYMYDNLITDADGNDVNNMYIQQSGGGSTGSFSTVYSYISDSFAANWDDLLSYYSQSGTGLPPIDLNGITLNINGVEISFLPPNNLFNSLQDLIDFINARSNPAVYAISLRDNIASLSENISNVTIEAGEGYEAGEATFVLKLNSSSSQKNITVDLSGVTTYNNLLTTINNALSAAGLGNTYKAVFNQNGDSDCYDLWLICKEPFQYKDSNVSSTASLYKYLLDHLTYDGTWISSSLHNIDDENLLNAWADFINSGLPLVRENGGKLELCFDADGNSSLQITGTNANRLREAFGIVSIDESEHSRKNRREITVSFTATDTGYTAKVIVSMASDTDMLNDDIYINVFGKAKDEIKLGSYYENIKANEGTTTNHPDDMSDAVADMLHRDPIKALYSSSYTSASTSENAVVDKYGCDYQLKFSTGVVGEKTYNELSSGNFPAYIVTLQPSYNTLRKFNNDDALYMRVDGIEYDGSYSFEQTQTDASGNTVTVVRKVTSERGYAKFNLSWFNSVQVSEFVKEVVNTFENQGIGGTPLLGSVLVEEDKIRIYTTSATYYSSISFGDTLPSIISYLFGINTSVVNSEEGQIDVDQIHYSYLSLTDYPAIGKDMKITYVSSQGIATTEKVAIGYQSTSFPQNVAAAFPDGEIIVDSKRLILADLSNNAGIKVEIKWANQVEKDAWLKMFTDLTWAHFHVYDGYIRTEDTEIDPEKTYYVYNELEDAFDVVTEPVASELDTYYEYKASAGTATCEYANSGDYYISLTIDESGNNTYILKIENPTKFPFGNIYAHMYEDYSYNHIVSSDNNSIVYTDEYNWNRLMTDRRVMLTEYIYKQPRFIPFDLAITCSLPNTEALSKTIDNYKSEIETFLRSEYGVYSDNIGKEISANEIALNIRNSFSTISNVRIDYLGYDMLTESTNKAELTTDFNQQHIIATYEESVEPVTDPETQRTTFETVIKHGLKINIIYKA